MLVVEVLRVVESAKMVELAEVDEVVFVSDGGKFSLRLPLMWHYTHTYNI